MNGGYILLDLTSVDFTSEEYDKSLFDDIYKKVVYALRSKKALMIHTIDTNDTQIASINEASTSTIVLLVLAGLSSDSQLARLTINSDGSCEIVTY